MGRTLAGLDGLAPLGDMASPMDPLGDAMAVPGDPMAGADPMGGAPAFDGAMAAMTVLPQQTWLKAWKLRIPPQKQTLLPSQTRQRMMPRMT